LAEELAVMVLVKLHLLGHGDGVPLDLLGRLDHLLVPGPGEGPLSSAAKATAPSTPPKQETSSTR
ncbi:MAG: hypothetical protein OEV64_06125, partial [Desulfobulbaceae bacterium]|nr:hypothetical protein [Desulfobulbaceae bacterium]